MFVFDILIYVIFAFIMSNLAKKSERITVDSQKWDKYLKMFVLFFCFISAIRWNVGSDSISYAHIFFKGVTQNERSEILWEYLVNTVHYSGLHWSIGIGIVAFLQIFFIVESVKKYRFILIILPFVLFGSRYWQDLSGASRQMIVACGFLWASKFIYQKSLWKYLLFILIAAQIHRSALLLIPFYLIPRVFQMENRRILLIVIFITCCILGQTSIFSGEITFFETLSNTIGYEDYTPVINNMIKAEKTDETLAFGPMMLTYLLIPIFIIWHGPILKQRYSKIIPHFSLWYNLAYIYACVYFLVCDISHIFIRPVMYLSLFQMIMASLLLYELIRTYKQNIMCQLACLSFATIIFTGSAWDIYKNAGKTWEFTTYKVFVMHSDQMSLFDMK